MRRVKALDERPSGAVAAPGASGMDVTQGGSGFGSFASAGAGGLHQRKLVVMPGIDTVRVRGTSLFRLGHSYVAEEFDVLRDISAQLHWKEPPAQRRARYGWPVPDESPGARGAWVIGK